MLLDTEGLNHRSFFCQTATVFFFYISKRKTSISPSLNRQAWTITISTEKKEKKKHFLLAFPNFWVSCCRSNSFFSIAKHSLYKQNQKSQQKVLRCTNMSHVPFLYFLFFTPQLLSSWAGRAKDSQFISRRICISPTAQLPSPSMLCVYWSKQNESQDGHIEVSCDWLRWYSAESELLSEMTILSFIFFVFSFNMMHCSSTVQTPLHICSCPDAVLEASPIQAGSRGGCEEQNGVENLFLSLQWERERTRQREKKRESPSIHVRPSNPSTL